VRARSDRDAGLTLVELLVTMALMAIVVALLPSLISTVFSSTSATRAIDANSAAARTALQGIELEVGSASELCLPTSLTATGPDVASGSAVRVLTDAFGTEHYEQWWLAGNGVLESQTWPATWVSGDAPGPVVAVASGISVPAGSSAFTVEPGSSGSPSALVIDFVVSSSSGQAHDSATVNGTVAALDTPYAPTNTCETSGD
jgi:prepilin-type N-terminal cleavage/methylation domain-containing protein